MNPAQIATVTSPAILRPAAWLLDPRAKSRMAVVAEALRLPTGETIAVARHEDKLGRRFKPGDQVLVVFRSYGATAIAG